MPQPAVMKLGSGKYSLLIINSEGSLKVNFDKTVHAVRLFSEIHPRIESGVEKLHCKKTVTGHYYNIGKSTIILGNVEAFLADILKIVS